MCVRSLVCHIPETHIARRGMHSMRKLIAVVLIALSAVACSTQGVQDDKGWTSQGRWTYTKEIQTSIGTCVLVAEQSGAGVAIFCGR